MRNAALALLSVGILAGCKDKTPARIQLANRFDVYDVSEKPANALLVNQAGEPVGGAVSYSATPSSVITVTADGRVRCLSSGDGSLLAAGGGQSATSTVRCRLVKKVSGPAELRLVKGRSPEPFTLFAEDAAGKTLQDVMLTVTSSNPQVVTVKGGNLDPLQVGTATITAAAGDASLSVPVTVLELIDSSPLALSDGQSRTIALQQGVYELDVSVKASNGAKYGVTISWVGTSCPAQAEAQTHRLRCEVAQTASLTITNPSAFGLGPSETGFVNLYRAPR